MANAEIYKQYFKIIIQYPMLGFPLLIQTKIIFCVWASRKSWVVTFQLNSLLVNGEALQNVISQSGWQKTYFNIYKDKRYAC